jgi:iron complex outermembrane receptor protein
MKLKTVLLCGVACAFAAGAAGAQAQTAGQAAAAIQSGAEASQVSEVIVTATKRNTKLEKTPIAITAFNQEALNRQGIKDVTDLARFVPSLEFAEHADQGSINLTLRGIGNDAAFTELADPEVALYVDGIYSPRAQGASVLMYDMQSVEVDRGPQGTLFGRNATAGAVNLITQRPDFNGNDGYVEVAGGSYNALQTRGAINLPVTDTFALRLAFITSQHDGYVNYQQPPHIPGINPSVFVTQGMKYYAEDKKSVRLSARWQPNDRFEWNLNLEGYQDTGAPVIALMQNPRPGNSLWTALIDTAPQTNRFQYGVRSEMDYHLIPGVDLVYIAGGGQTGGSANNDSDAGSLAVTDTKAGFQEDHTVWSHYWSHSHEIQLKSTGNQRVDWILGGYYSHEDNSIRFDIDIRNGYRLGTFGWAGSFIQPERIIQSRAAFGQAVWHVTDRIRLTGGLRYTDDSKQDIGGRNVTFNGCPTGDTTAQCDALTAAGAIGPNTPGIFGIEPSASPNQLLALLGPGYGISNNDVKASWNKLTWLARADMDITNNILGYISAGTGFKSGNIEDGGKTAGPETLTNYEIGSKIRFWDGRATLNLAGYYEDFVGYQVNQAVTTRNPDGSIKSSQLVTQNAKGAQVYGFEAELNAQLTHADHVQFSFTAMHSALDELLSIDARLHSSGDIASLVELKGHALPHVPDASGTFMYEHRFDLGSLGELTPRITTHFETSSWLSYFEQDAPDRQSGYTRTDLLLHYQPLNSPWSAEAFVLNIEDTRVKASAEASGAPNYAPVWLSIYAPPTTWGVRLRRKF